jgi:hypothetical protein
MTPASSSSRFPRGRRGKLPLPPKGKAGRPDKPPHPERPPAPLPALGALGKPRRPAAAVCAPPSLLLTAASASLPAAPVAAELRERAPLPTRTWPPLSPSSAAASEVEASLASSGECLPHAPSHRTPHKNSCTCQAFINPLERRSAAQNTARQPPSLAHQRRTKASTPLRKRRLRLAQTRYEAYQSQPPQALSADERRPGLGDVDCRGTRTPPGPCP